MPEQPDIQFQKHGSVVSCLPVTNAGKEWLEANIDVETLPVYIEFRYLEDIVLVAREDGIVCH